ncbi:MAG TPA: glycerol-3-phosphate acyltransferase [Anaerolineales bacterium]|nr:glycerol-3-phosphate acyltransferase [Anaerolineales bacterium]
MPILSALGFIIFGYLCGSLTFSIWIVRLLKGVDVRDAGSGHATTTNTIRQAGFAAGALVLVLDIAKGYVPSWLALHYAPLPYRTWIAAISVAAAVAGHCWPLFGRFRGGMGLATAAGGGLAASALAFLIAAAILIFLTLVMHHGARASVVTAVVTAPVFWLLGLRGPEFWIAVFGGVVLVLRFLGDWNRQYRELWLDRE